MGSNPGGMGLKMRISSNSRSESDRQAWSRDFFSRPIGPLRAFTLIEVLVTMALVVVLMASSFSALIFLNRSSSSLASHVAATAAVQGQLEKVRALTYNPPNGSYFKSTTTRWTNNQAIFLSKEGTNLLVAGTIIAEIQPSGTHGAAGHLVTVTGTFATPGKPTVVSLQTLVNRFSGGQP